MNASSQTTLAGVLIAIVVVVALGVGTAAVLWMDFSGDEGSGLGEEFEYDLAEFREIDPALVRYRQTSEIPVGLDDPRAVAVGPEDRIFVAGDKAVRSFSPAGDFLTEWIFDAEPQCLAVGSSDHVEPGCVYVGMKDSVEVRRTETDPSARWPSPGERTVITSIAVAENDVFVADAGNKIVWHYDAEGKLLGRIGRRDPDRQIPGFVIPSPHFDVAMAPDGLLRVVNPGMHRIEAYTLEGHLELSWGERGTAIEKFCGCCNPAAMAVLPDGRIVTGEKGIPRVKVYGVLGEFEGVVVGPNTLAPRPGSTEETRAEHKLRPVDLAADSGGRILVLDPGAGLVRVFEPKPRLSEPEE